MTTKEKFIKTIINRVKEVVDNDPEFKEVIFQPNMTIIDGKLVYTSHGEGEFVQAGQLDEKNTLKLAKRIQRSVRKNNTEDDEWWVSSSQESVIECAKQMLKAGIPYDEVENLVSSLISVGTSQYGG